MYSRFDYEKWKKQNYREHHIFCPHCDAEFKDEGYECISYHGTDDSGELSEIQCPNCEKVFYVEEIVDRRYKTAKRESELGVLNYSK